MVKARFVQENGEKVVCLKAFEVQKLSGHNVYVIQKGVPE